MTRTSPFRRKKSWTRWSCPLTRAWYKGVHSMATKWQKTTGPKWRIGWLKCVHLSIAAPGHTFWLSKSLTSTWLHLLQKEDSLPMEIFMSLAWPLCISHPNMKTFNHSIQKWSLRKLPTKLSQPSKSYRKKTNSMAYLSSKSILSPILTSIKHTWWKSKEHLAILWRA